MSIDSRTVHSIKTSMTSLLFLEMTLTAPVVNVPWSFIGLNHLFCIFLKTGIPRHARKSIYDIPTFYISVYFKTPVLLMYFSNAFLWVFTELIKLTLQVQLNHSFGRSTKTWMTNDLTKKCNAHPEKLSLNCLIVLIQVQVELTTTQKEIHCTVIWEDKLNMFIE